ncbi:MAG: Gldg family protein [Planctomycetota bacterium]
MRNIVAITMKELRMYFRTPIAYVIIALFLGLTGWLFFFGSKFFLGSEATMRAFFEPLPWIFLIFIPAITMRLWSEEKKVGTIEVLFTMPVRSFEAVLGKFFGAVLLVAVMLALSFSIPAVVAYVGDPDPGPIWGGYVGALLLASAYVGIGLFASSLTENQIIAFLTAVVIGFFFFILDSSGLEGFVPSFAKQFSLNYHFDSVGRGVIDLRDLAYYASFCGFFLVLNAGILRGLRKQAAMTVGLITAVLVIANVVLTPVRVRLDLTEGGLYTLHADTKKLLQRVDDDLNVNVYLTPAEEMPPEFASLPRDIRDSLDEFRAYAKGRLNVKIINPSASDKHREEAEKMGIFPIDASVVGSESLTYKKVYLGLVVEYGDKTEKLAAITNPQSLEYDLAVAISKVTRATSPQIAFNVTNSIPPGLPPQFRQQFQQQNEDKHDVYGDYEVPRKLVELQFGNKGATTVKLDAPVPPEVETLVICNADGVNDVGQFYLDQFIMRGGKAMFLVDGANMEGGRGMPRDPKWDDFFTHYGFKVNKDVVLDKQCEIVTIPERRGPFMVQLPVRYPPFVIVTDIDQAHPITRGLKTMLMTWPASIELSPPPGVEGSVLARSSEQAWKMENVFMLNPSPPIEPPQKGLQKFNLVGVLTGKWKSFYAERPLPEALQPKAEAPKTEGSDDKAGDKKETGAAPAAPEPEAHAKEKEAGKADGPKPDGDSSAAKPADGQAKHDGGSGIAQETDVPGGGIVRQEPKPPEQPPAEPPKADDKPKAEPQPAEPKADGSQKTEPAPDDQKKNVPGRAPQSPPVPGAGSTEAKKPPEVVKESQKPTTIVVIGTSSMMAGNYAGPNQTFFANAVEYLTVGDELLGVRARQAPSRKFEAPEQGTRRLLQFAGTGVVPVLTVLFGFLSYLYRRNVRRKGVSL